MKPSSLNLFLRIFERLKKKRRTIYSFINEHDGIDFGDGNLFLDSTFFKTCFGYANIKIGSNCIINGKFIFETTEAKIFVGNNTWINSGAQLISATCIDIGDDVVVGYETKIVDHNSHSLNVEDRLNDIVNLRNTIEQGHYDDRLKDWSNVKKRKVTVCNKAWIGAHCTILSGVTIGEGAIIGANSVVRNDIEPWSIAYGNPASVVKKLKYKESF